MANPAVPLLICTGVPPAKSSPPRLKTHPPAFHVQHAIGSYTSVLHQKMKNMIGPNRPRSAIAPTASIGLYYLKKRKKEREFSSEHVWPVERKKEKRVEQQRTLWPRT